MNILVSVSDTSGLTDLLRHLNGDVYATPGTFKFLSDSGIKAKRISDITGFDDLLNGRVKTLHPAVFSGILSRRDEQSEADLKRYNYFDFDIVICNLYNFESYIDKSIEDMIENIDIGGLSLIRAAAKNYQHVTVASSPEDYNIIIKDLRDGEISLRTRETLALRAFARAAYYDMIIYKSLYKRLNNDEPEELFIHGYDRTKLRYGENPDQAGFLYRTDDEYGIPNAVQLNGKELSYNNIIDADSALETVLEFDEPTAVIVKHRTPSGVSSADNIRDAFINAYSSDEESAYGFVLALNRKVDEETAMELSKHYIEVLIAPDYDEPALNILKKKKNLRILKAVFRRNNSYVFQSIPGGLLMQSPLRSDFTEMKCMTIEADERTKKDLLFAWRVSAHCKSNAIVLAKNLTTTGIGAGQTSRIESLRIAVQRSNGNAKGSVMASDGFIPFNDSIIEANKNGIKAIIEPGGSIRDNDVIQKAIEYKIPLYFTGKRVFLH
ncbi:bifunctional phosphoribosylaminoimidazolecarboxamide formyltransferase/IMP cyclohydrolase [Picrophilus oshimae]|uniref:Phosphoribosylaminoimidazolecarboxamide formyltransferase n=1 Tax=Picrophilus torridus (strain ATCC 700027 / DSM 9790 / JCM 10055 / NBRC 100828 / KAW 2/3) TaxID=1122961 RepID=Q6L122_PICTO|nr:bifunctional phosphoribosylaminoimidazolecarboxamide formyltransferase/IMP cyclohydrolase [Picrophilus oshimae]AAT43330.1 phosphoribosylaminoimidazolecarboxamide formyltransferase [Picrophilus oshimae DSM 9789]SMD30362.1 IMP cyclohydrolase /phosphoribosylaminoimidazolecarboxamide formyltransferase [Picrophilus oshimae DSM 9789]